MNKTTLTWDEVSDLSGKDEHRNIVISEDIADMDMTEIFDKFIKPLLWGIGYHTEVVDNWFKRS